MSWGFKPLEAITQPGVTAFVTLDPDHPEGLRPTELRDYYEAAADLKLPDSVPEAVREYFDTVRMLWVYGWFYYPFYSVATVHTGLCVEIALKERFRSEGIPLSRKSRTLEKMLEQAVQRRWIRPDGFETIRRREENEAVWIEIEAEWEDELASPMLAPSERASRMEAGMRRLIDLVRKSRNRRAHPTGLSLLMPGMTYAELQFVCDLIRQLFASRA